MLAGQVEVHGPGWYGSVRFGTVHTNYNMQMKSYMQNWAGTVNSRSLHCTVVGKILEQHWKTSADLLHSFSALEIIVFCSCFNFLCQI